MVMISTHIFNGKKKAIINQIIDTETIPEINLEEISAENFPKIFSEILPIPAMVGKKKINENKR